MGNIEGNGFKKQNDDGMEENLVERKISRNIDIGKVHWVINYKKQGRNQGPEDLIIGLGLGNRWEPHNVEGLSKNPAFCFLISKEAITFEEAHKDLSTLVNDSSIQWGRLGYWSSKYFSL